MSEIEVLELELFNEKLLLQDYKESLKLFDTNKLSSKLLESLNLDEIKYRMRTYSIFSDRIKEIETHIVELQEKIGDK